MQLQLKHTRLKIDWLTLLFPVLAAVLGEGYTAAALFLSLALHESAHFLTARAAHVSIHTLRLTPFGGLALIENPYAVSAPKLCLIAASGPAANLLLLLLSAALCHWRILGIHTASTLIQVNAMLMLFNLLPALPLDGGRILYSVLSTFIPRRRAMETGILLGRVLSILLIALALWGWLSRGRLNLSPVLAAIFLLTSSADERRALTDSRLQGLLNSLQPLAGPQPAGIIAVSSDTPPETALKFAFPDRITLYAVYHEGKLDHFTDDRTLVSRLIAANDKKAQNN